VKEVVELRPAVSGCRSFRASENSEFELVTLVISPIKIVESGRETRIAWACNNGENCFNERCSYAFGRQRLADIAEVPLE